MNWSLEKPIVSQSVRDAARMMPCTLNIAGVCRGRHDTTVGAHVRIVGMAGVGTKPTDLSIVFACQDCHDALDRRTKAPAEFDEDKWFYVARGLIRSYHLMIRAGVMSISGEDHSG